MAGITYYIKILGIKWKSLEFSTGDNLAYLLSLKAFSGRPKPAGNRILVEPYGVSAEEGKGLSKVTKGAPIG